MTSNCFVVPEYEGDVTQLKVVGIVDASAESFTAPSTVILDVVLVAVASSA